MEYAMSGLAIVIAVLTLGWTILRDVTGSDAAERSATAAERSAKAAEESAAIAAGARDAEARAAKEAEDREIERLQLAQLPILDAATDVAEMLRRIGYALGEWHQRGEIELLLSTQYSREPAVPASTGKYRIPAARFVGELTKAGLMEEERVDPAPGPALYRAGRGDLPFDRFRLSEHGRDVLRRLEDRDPR